MKADIHLNVDGAKVVESVGNLTLLVEAPESAWEQLSALRYVVSVEENAENTATAMRQNGMVPTVKTQSSQGKTFWRVVVGPATSASERSTLLNKIKGVGFDDAYPVTN